MPEEQPISAKDFGASFKGFLEKVSAETPPAEPVFLRRFRDHFGTEVLQLPIVSQAFPHSDHQNLHLAVEAYVHEDGRSAELLGVTGGNDYIGISVAQLLTAQGGGLWGGSGLREGPVQYVNLPQDDEGMVACVQSGLYLVSEGAHRHAVLVAGPSRSDFMGGEIRVEVMSVTRELAEGMLATVRTSMRRRNIYRGHAISLTMGERHTMEVKFHRLPQVQRDGIILPSGLLERIERLAIGLSRHAEALKAAGRHLKRGLLLHGAPGTGKTLTAMYLAAQMSGRTVLILTGGGFGMIEASCAMARALQPSTFILEDVDLVAEERTYQARGCNTVLFELLNQMDGLAEDADVLFLLTTNRPDILEPALASRPGRIDQAFEIPLPDEENRRRLIELYSRGLEMRLSDLPKLLQRTEGVSAAFLRELLRKAALFAADEGTPIVVADRHVDEAMHELLVEGGELTQGLLGARRAPLGFKPGDGSRRPSEG